jgi:uncharacterized spore protein YtfJ
MSTTPFESLRSMVATLREHAGVESVYGTPVAAGDRTIVPVARVRYGFGGGFGSSDEGGAGDESGEGGGVGGGLTADPVGVVELTPNGVRLVRFGGARRLLAALGAGVALGFLLGRRGG